MKLFYCPIIILLVSACNTATNTDKEIITEQNTNKDSVAAAIDDSAATSKKRTQLTCR